MEIELNCSIDQAADYLKFIGLQPIAYHETIREKWSLENLCKELVIDTIPGLPTYLEVECKDEGTVQKIAEQLDLDINDATYGPYGEAFNRLYGIGNDQLSFLTFQTVYEKLEPFLDTEDKKKLLKEL